MSGIFGIVDSKRQSSLQGLTKTMAAVMSHREWFMSESFVDDEQGVALGRIGIGIFNKTSQPVWNSTRTIALVMAGELYDRDALGISVLESDEQAALALYESQGEQLHLQSRSPADAELRDLYAATFEVGRRAFYTTGAPLREGFSSLASYAP